MPPKLTVFPMRVGMNRYIEEAKRIDERVPHACGDEPPHNRFFFKKKQCSPCVWG